MFAFGSRLIPCDPDLRLINACRRLARGAVCPPRTPPECFSWFCFGAGLRHFHPNSAFHAHPVPAGLQLVINWITRPLAKK